MARPVNASRNAVARTTKGRDARPDVAAPDAAFDVAPTMPAHVPEAGKTADMTDRGISAHEEEVWALANRVQGLHRAQAALREILKRRQGALARTVSVRPDIDITSDSAAHPVAQAPGDDDPWWPDRPDPGRPLTPPPGYHNFGTMTEAAKTIACLTLGLHGRDLEAAVSAAIDRLRGQVPAKPVFITDSDDLSPITREGFVAEYISAKDRLDAPTKDGPAIDADRFAGLQRKWNFDTVVDLGHLKAEPQPVTLPGAAVPIRPKPNGPRPRAAVVSWDLGHNPAGRAIVLYDLLERDYEVELVGPIWSRFGSKLWSPIRNSSRKVRSFPCNRFEDFWPKAVALAADADYDLVVVCKPQLPGLLLGAMIKKTCDCPLVLDIDEFELCFYADQTPAALEDLEAAGPDALSEPYLELPARVCDGLVRETDARTVSNIALRRRFGGLIVRHARDEAVFDPDRFDRDAARAAMGIADTDFAIFFVGTIRRHKGVFEVARTLDSHRDKRLALHLVGEFPDQRMRRELEQFTNARIHVHPGCTFDELPSRLVAADAVVLLQDPSHAISQFQIPAKVSDAAAFGLPLITTDVPPLRDLVLQGLVRTIDQGDLASGLDDLIREHAEGSAADIRQSVREGFLAELGFDVNRERLSAAINRASRARPGLTNGLARLISVTTDAYGQIRSAGKATAPPAPAVAKGQIDIAMFWKQNDSGLYGRRSDMLMSHLLDSGRVRRVLQFDAPMPLSSLAERAGHGPGNPASHILRNTVDNQLGLRDSDRHLMRTFLWDERNRATLFPDVGTDLADYPDYVATQMERNGLKPETTLAWVCPVVFDFPQVAAHVPFLGIIGDLIDDQRRFDAQDAYRNRVSASYEETLPLFDLTFTNCQPMADAFRDLAGEIHVVPNGTEPGPDNPGDAPAALRGLRRPIAGYVGNLRDRYDWDLMREVALRLPDVSFPIIGGGARPQDTAKVRDVPNIHLLGMVPHDQVAACIAAFDVALMPHERNPLTMFMNPLKIYSYFAAKRPIVATGVSNIDEDLAPFIRFSDDAEGFAAAVRLAARAPLDTGPRYQQALSKILWDARVRQVLETLDAWLDTTAT